ncbi:hypothetical protein HYDPIDRAFT_29768 [Hydnomerulius pinastri MD-312]|uniref:Unplaced genomic scaffold scaffold_18, whole genome shotgun sequence n=1 Tax=Hydnomerulius pinastri MD-312 TaxID=994086 RepID=A0A0C9WDJ0_9AGAM|nr:hypothetical protein HYDPIDRAFT_29768 [Hydnomerulius pinastri MD-312]
MVGHKVLMLAWIPSASFSDFDVFANCALILRAPPAFYEYQGGATPNHTSGLATPTEVPPQPPQLEISIDATAIPETSDRPRGFQNPPMTEASFIDSPIQDIHDATGRLQDELQGHVQPDFESST